MIFFLYTCQISLVYISMFSKFNIYLDNKKYIDTRTFTRPKKRSSRISFESVFLGLPPYAKNILRLKNTDTIHMDDVGYSLIL